MTIPAAALHLQAMDKAHIAELQNINLSLHTLGRCIEALASGSAHVRLYSGCAGNSIVFLWKTFLRKHVLVHRRYLSENPI